MKKTGWERENREHFDDIVVNYDKIRPDYPCELFEDIFKYSNCEKSKTAIEIGAGTGKATTPILDKGYEVTAVEISKNMTNFLVHKFGNYSNFNAITGSFEDISLKENSYDLIYAGSAFHWVNAEIGCPKAFNLLKNGGVITLFRYNQIKGESKIYEDIQAIYEKYYYSYYTSTTRPTKKRKEDFMKPQEIYIGYRFEALQDYGFKDINMKFYDVTKTYTANEHIALLETLADHRSLPAENKTSLFAEIKDVIIRHGNKYKVDYIFQLYMGRK